MAGAWGRVCVFLFLFIKVPKMWNLMQISPDSLNLAQRITITSRITSRQFLLLIFSAITCIWIQFGNIKQKPRWSYILYNTALSPPLSSNEHKLFQCHFVPVANLTRGWWQEKKKGQSVTLVAPENMEILDFSVWENEKHCLVKKSGIWIESFNCVQSESGQMLLWSSRAWRKFICKLHPIFGKNSFFFQFRSRCRIDTEQSLFHLSSCTQTSKMDLSSNILKYTTQTALCILIYFAYVTLELHITKHFCMYSILEAIKYFEKFDVR